MKGAVLLTATALALLLAAPLRGDDRKSNPDEVGDRRVARRSIISQEKEIAIGKQLSLEVERSAKMFPDPVVVEYVNRVAQNVARNSDLKVPLTVKVIDDPSINAFALPGGFLYVNTGLLGAVDEEDQLAGVVAHEVAHVACRHWASQVTKATLLQLATIPLILTPMTYPVYVGVSEAMNLGVPLAFLKFDRDDEAEADYYGIQYMWKAGYDPNSYVAFFGKVIQEERRVPGSVPRVFADHPPTGERILRSEEEIKKILPRRDEYLVTTSEFDSAKERLQQLAARKKPELGGPSLRKRPADDDQGKQPQQPQQDDGQPPVLKRKDPDYRARWTPD